MFKHGTQVEYFYVDDVYSDGSNKLNFMIVEGDYHGPFTKWFYSGGKEQEGNYSFGKKNGLWVYWYKNNKKKAEGNYTKGIMDEGWKYWYQNGQIMQETVQDGTEKKTVYWYENGLKSAERKTDTLKRSVEEICWDKNGNQCDCMKILNWVGSIKKE